jgi:N12 class adenine-specific DNA methylase
MALTLDQYREQNPSFSGVSDAALARHLHGRYYGSMPFADYASAIGYTPIMESSEVDSEASGDFTRGAKESFQQLPQMGKGLLAAGAATAENLVGEGGYMTGIKKAAIKGYQEDSAEMAAQSKPSDSLTYSLDGAKQGNFGDLVDWVQHGIGYAAGQGTQLLATGFIGGAIAKGGVGLAAKEVAERLVATEVAKIAEEQTLKAGANVLIGEALTREATRRVAENAAIMGTKAAIGASAFGMEGGEIGGDLVNQAEKENRQLTGEELAKAFGATIAAGSLEYLGDKIGLDVLTGKSKVINGLMGTAGEIPGLKGRAIRGAIGGIAAAPVEGATEYGQTLVEEYGKGNDPFSAESKQQAFDAAGLGALGGQAMGTVGGLLSAAKEPAPRPSVADIGKATTVDDAIIAAGNAVNAATPAQRDRNTGSELNLTNGLPVSDGVDAAIANSANALNIDNINLASKSARDAQLERLIELDAANKGNRSSGYLTPIEKQEYISLRQQLDIPPIEGEFLGKENAVGQPNHIAGAIEGDSIDGEVLRTQNQLGEQLKLGQSGQIENKPLGGLLNHEKEKTQTETGYARLSDGSVVPNDSGFRPDADGQSGTGLAGDVAGLPTGEQNTEGQDVRDTGWGIPEKLTKPADAIPSITTENINGDQTSEKANAETRQERLLEPKAPEQSGAFVPTHELNDGTPVIQTGEDTFVDEHGDEWQANDAMPIVGKTEESPKQEVVSTKAKQPWEITRDEYFANPESVRSDAEKNKYPKRTEQKIAKGGKSIKNVQLPYDNGELFDFGKAHHKAQVEDALAEGKPVPENVLSDYPELQSPASLSTEQAPETQLEQPVEPVAKEPLSTTAQADNSNQDPILSTNQKAWVKAQLKERKIKIGSPGYKAKHEELNAEYEAELDKALAHAPFDVYAAHPSNKGASENILKSSHDSLRGEYGVADNLDGIIGDKIDGEWTGFHENSGSIGIPRSEMPQVKAEHRGALVNFLNAKGVSHEQIDIPAKDLKPTQAEFSPAKVEKAKNYTDGDRSILISSDNHVVDGHHQWLAKLHNDEDVKAIRLNAPIKSLINQVSEFPSSETADGSTETTEQSEASKSKIETPAWWQEKKLAERIRTVTSIGGKYSAWDNLDAETQHALNDKFGGNTDKPIDIYKNADWKKTDVEGVEHNNTTSPVQAWRYKEGQPFSGSKLIPEYESFYDAELVKSLPTDIVSYIQKEVRDRVDWYENRFGVARSSRPDENLGEAKKPESKLNESDATKAFSRYEEALSKVQKGSSSKATGKELILAKKEFNQSKEALQPYGEWTLEQAKKVLSDVESGVKLPSGYSFRLSGNDKPFIAGDIRSPSDVSLHIKKNDASDGDTDQFKVEVRVFTDTPRAYVYFTEGSQYAFQGKKVSIFDGKGTLSTKTYQELSDGIIPALNDAISNFIDSQSANTEPSKPEWYTDMPEHGLDILPDELRGVGYRTVVGRIARDAADAITRNQKISNEGLYIYVLPATNGRNGIARFLPEDQNAPKPWQLIGGTGIRAGSLTQDELVSKTTALLGNSPIIGWVDSGSSVNSGSQSNVNQKPKNLTKEEGNRLFGIAAKTPAKPKRNPKSINDTDDILAVIAKLGGISAIEAKAQGIDRASLSKRGSGILRVFNNGANSQSYDGMAETLRQYGFDTQGANDLVDLVSRAINQGEKIYNAVGYEKAAELKQQEHFDDEQVKLAFDLENKIESGDIDIADIDDAIESIDDIFETNSVSGQDAVDSLDDFFGITNDETTNTGSTAIPQEEILGGYTEAELEEKEREQKQRAKQEAEAELKAKQKAQADKEIDTAADEMLGNFGTGDIFGMSSPMEKPKDAPKLTSAEMDALDSEIDDVLGDIGRVLMSRLSLKAVPEQSVDLLPLMSKLMGLAVKKGYLTFEQNAKYVLDIIRDKFGDKIADTLDIDDLQGGYIAMKKGTTTKRDVVNYESIEELMQSANDYVKKESNQPENGNETNTGTKTNAGNDTGKAPNKSGISDKQPRQPEQSGANAGNSDLRDGQEQSAPTDSSESQGDGLSSDEGMVGYGTDAGDQQTIKQSASKDGSVSKHLGDDNYSLIDKPNIVLSPAKRRDINILATEILKKPVDDVTEADKEVLRQYTGNGGLDLKASEDKGAGIFNQHYTSYDTIKAMYGALSDAGIKMENNLEPSVGSGNFIGMNPRAKWTAVDIDKTNTEVVERLYPDAKVFNESYETFRGKNFDLIISNVPFASFSSLAREHAGTIKPAFKAIHNFFFAQSIDKLKTGGVMAFMTSTGTMDGSVEAAKLRAHIIKDMDVIGAFRLPMGTQKANASTDVMIDTIFLQKRPDGVPSKQPEKNQSFVDIASKDGYKINKYFVDYPDSVLGDLSIGNNKTSMGKIGWIVTGEADYSKMKIEPQDYTSTEKLSDKANDFSNHDTAQAYADKHGYKFVDQETKPYFDNGIIYDIPVTYNEQSGGGLFGRKATGANADKLSALKKIDETHDAELVHDYEVKYGKNPHSDKPLALYAKANYAEQQLKSYLALFDKHFNLSEIFTKQVRFKDSGKIEVTSESPLFDRAESLEDADGIFSPKTDLVSEDEIQELLDSGDYAKLGNGSLQNSRLYYAGNIYKKLDDAGKVKPAAQRDKQIAKLTRSKPALIPIKNVTVTGKESWLPDSAIASIGKRTYSDGAVIIGENAIADNHLLHLFNQYVNNEPLVKKGKDDTPEEYTDRLKSAQSVLHNDVIPLIKQKLMDDGLADEVVDAYNKAKNFFAAPVFDGSSLRNLPKTFKGKPFNLLMHQQEGIERAIYNKKGVLAFAPGLGKTPAAIVVADQLLQKGVMKKPLFIVPANTIPQWESTARMLYPDAKIYEFPKYTSGINKGKPKEWPSMSAADKEKMVYDLTNNRYDYTFISTNLAQKFSVPTNKLSQYLDELTESISGMEKPDDELTKSQIKAKETRLAKIRMLKATMMAAYAESTASGFDMGKMGFDALFADEVQYYKNIGMQSEEAKGGIGANVAITAKYPLGTDGKQDKELSPLSVTIGSSRSYDFRFKTRYISENNNGNNVFLLTGTPTPNKPLELMTLLHHLDTKILDEYGIKNVGEFVDEFLDVQEVEEIGIDGNNKMNPQLVGIKNIFGLKKIISRYVDYRSPESAPDLTRPKQIDKTHIILQNDDAEAIFADIQERILKSIEDGKAKMQGEHVVAEPMIKMYGAGRDASIDVRLYSPSKDEKGSIQPGTVFEKETRADYSKIAKTVELVAAKNKLDPEAGQLIFLDRLKFSDGSGSTHEDIRSDILKATGLSPQEVVFVNGAEYVNPITGKVAKNIKPAALQQIMDLYNDGKIKVLIGNTSKLGVGVDLQVTTTDIYQIDKPYRPDEIEQRNNRGVRQGNRNSEVTVHTFNQPGTFDAMSDRIIANKQGFNDVFWKDQESDKADVKGEEAPSHYDAAIELEQNPIKKRKLEIERDLQQASSKSNQIEKQISNLAKRIRVANENKLAYSNAIINSDKREPPKYEDQSPVERKKSLIAFKKRTADQRALNVTRVADIETDLVELEANKEVRVNELEDHKAYIADIRAKYVVNGVVSLDAIQDRINIDPDTKNKIEALESFISCVKS